jgi:ethanolamine utilization protein EutN
MRIAEVIGKVTLCKCEPSLNCASWKLAVPLSQAALRGADGGRGEAFVVYDEQGAGDGSIIAVSEGAEASAPFHPQEKPIDAYNAAILDRVNLD